MARRLKSKMSETLLLSLYWIHLAGKISIIFVIYLNSIKKMGRNKQSLRFKITQFEQANNNFEAKLQQLFFYLKLYPIELVRDYITKPSNILTKIKWLILFNHIITDQDACKSDKIGDLIHQLTLQQNAYLSSIDKLLYDKLFHPYKLYLQKRQCLNQSKEGKKNSTYQLINTIRSALCFTDILFTIGRYLFKKNFFLVEFNLAIGKDLADLYKKLKIQLSEQQKIMNAEIIEKMNEGLYNIYYNCYFSQFTSRLAPVWINTQEIFNRSKVTKQSSPLKNYRQVQEIDLANDSILVLDSLGKGLQECEGPKSTSTIDSCNESEASSRLQFINLAENWLLMMRKMQGASKVIN